MAVPVYTNRKVAGSQGVNVPVSKDITSTVDFSTQKNALDAMAQIERDKSEAEGVSEYLKFKEASAGKVAELSLLNGSNADGLANKYDEWKDEYTNNLEFKDGISETSFYDREEIDSANNRINLGKYETSEALEYSNQVKDASINSNMLDGKEALYNEDTTRYAMSMGMAHTAYAEKNTGKPEALIDQEFATVRDEVLTSLLQQDIKNGESKKAYITMQNAETAKAVDKATALRFKEVNKAPLSGEVANDITQVTIDSFENYTAGEWAQLNGVDTSDWTEQEKDKSTTNRRSYVAQLNKAAEELKDFKYEGDQYISGDARYNEMVEENINKSLRAISKQANTSQTSAVDDLNTKITDLIYEKQYKDKDLAEVARINAEIEGNVRLLANEYGEYKLVSKIKDLEQKESLSIHGEFSKVYFGILAGTQDSRSIIESDKLDWKEKNALTSTYNKMKVENMTSKYASLTSEMLLSMTGKDDIEDLDPSSKTAYEGAVNALISELTNKDIETMTNDDIDRLLRESVSVGWTQLDVQQLKAAKRAAKSPLEGFKEDAREFREEFDSTIFNFGKNLLKRF